MGACMGTLLSVGVLAPGKYGDSGTRHFQWSISSGKGERPENKGFVSGFLEFTRPEFTYASLCVYSKQQYLFLFKKYKPVCLNFRKCVYILLFQFHQFPVSYVPFFLGNISNKLQNHR